MEFRVIFKYENGNAIDIRSQEIGLKGIREAEILLGKEVTIEEIDPKTQYYYSEPSVTISRNIAKESKHFEEKNTILVNVDQLLNKYCEYKVYKTDNFSFQLGYELNKTELLKDWIEAGYPLDFNIGDK